MRRQLNRGLGEGPSPPDIIPAAKLPTSRRRCREAKRRGNPESEAQTVLDCHGRQGGLAMTESVPARPGLSMAGITWDEHGSRRMQIRTPYLLFLGDVADSSRRKPRRASRIGAGNGAWASSGCQDAGGFRHSGFEHRGGRGQRGADPDRGRGEFRRLHARCLDRHHRRGHRGRARRGQRVSHAARLEARNRGRRRTSWPPALGCAPFGPAIRDRQRHETARNAAARRWHRLRRWQEIHGPRA